MLGLKELRLDAWLPIFYLLASVTSELTGKSPLVLNIRDVTNTSDLSATAAAALAYERSLYVNGQIDEDPFYTSLPMNCQSAAPGSLLKLEETTNVSLYTLPPATTLSRIVYQSQDFFSNKTVPVSAYVLWPYVPRPGKDGVQVVAYSHGTSGLTHNCAPSHIRNLWQHYLAPYQLVLQGYVVVAPDFAGLGVPRDCSNHSITLQYSSSPSYANDLVYSVQAARKAFPQLSSEFVVVGDSDGGGAAWGVARRQATQPVEGYLGAVAIAPLTNFLDETSAFASLLAAAVSTGIQSIFPEFKLDDVVTPMGVQALNLMYKYGGCLAFLENFIANVTVKEGWQQNPTVQKWAAEVENGGKEISGPLLVFHGEADATVSFNLTVQAVAMTKAAFPNSQLEFIKQPGMSHTSVVQASQSTYMDWIRDRFDGVAIPQGVRILKASPIRPTSAYQTVLNWFIGLATEFYEAT